MTFQDTAWWIRCTHCAGQGASQLKQVCLRNLPIFTTRTEGEEKLSKGQQLQIAYFFKNLYVIKIPSKSEDLLIMRYKPLLAAFESVTEAVNIAQKRIE